jgi:hypothetical protein
MVVMGGVEKMEVMEGMLVTIEKIVGETTFSPHKLQGVDYLPL